MPMSLLHRLLALPGSLCLLMLPTMIAGQPLSPGPRYGLEMSVAYHDLLRQSSDRIRSTVLARDAFCSLRACWDSDTVGVAVLAESQYWSFTNRSSSFSSAVQASNALAVIRWNGAWQWTEYEIHASVPVDRRAQFGRFLGASVALRPLDAGWTIGGSWQRAPSTFGGIVSVEDFLAATDEPQETSRWEVRFGLSPLSCCSLRASWQERWTVVDGNDRGYSIPHRFGSFGYRAAATIALSSATKIGVEQENRRYAMTAVANRDGTMFGDVAGGIGTSREWSVKLEFPFLRLPVTVEGTHLSADLNAVGHLESWPFTSLAATVFDNRMNYVIDGTIRAVSLTGETGIGAGKFTLQPSMTFTRLWTDLTATHWEPEFLVFGVKNFRVDPFSVARSSLLTFSIRLMVPLFRGHLEIAGLQIVPLAVSNRGTAISPGQPELPSAAEGRETIDGGRSIRLTWKIL